MEKLLALAILKAPDSPKLARWPKLNLGEHKGKTPLLRLIEQFLALDAEQS